MNNRENIKDELAKLIEEYHLEKKLTVELVIEWIAQEDEQDAMKANQDYQDKWLKYFMHEPDIDKVNNILEVFTDAWNYFPHKSLNNRSPMEMFK